MKNSKFKPKVPTQKDFMDSHCVDIAFCSPMDSIVNCPTCKKIMKKIDCKRFICTPTTRKKMNIEHYKRYKPEPIDLIEKYQLNFSEGCFVKYMLRCEFKGDKLGDLKKALYYLNISKPNSFRRGIKYGELRDYYLSKKFSDEHLNCLLWFISGHNFETIKLFLEREIHNLKELQNG